MSNIFSTIRKEVQQFTEDYISIVDGYSFNQYQNIKKIHLYYNSRFVNGELDANGRKKIFFNIVKAPCKVASRFLNFDTKDIRLVPMNETSEMSTFLLEKELKTWMKINKIANIMNEVASYAPIYGSAVLKKTKKGAELIDLRKLILDPTVKGIQDSRFIEIEHNLTPSQLRDKEKDGWKNIEEAIEKFYVNNAPKSYIDSSNINQVLSTPNIKVYERFGEVPESWLNSDEVNYSDEDKSEKMVRALFIVCGVESYATGEDKKTITKEEGLILFKSKWHGPYPFKDYHYDKTEGRWQGIGVVEDLFQIQERTNELTNEKRDSMAISSKHIFQTQDRTVVKNILRDLTNGSVLMSGPNGGLVPLANEERNLSAFAGEEARYATQAKELTFSYDAIRGEALPTSTPATNAVIQDRNSSSVYKFKRENLGNMWRDFFNDFVLPQCVKDLTPEHMMMFIGTPEELDRVDTLIIKNIASRLAIEELLNSGAPVDYEMIKETVRQKIKEKGANRFILMKEKFYKDTEFQFDINDQNEQEDASVMSQNLFSVIQAISSHPAILQDPVIKELFYTYAEKIGVSPMKLELAAQAKDQAVQMAQSIPQAPAQPNMEQTTKMEQRVNQQ